MHKIGYKIKKIIPDTEYVVGDVLELSERDNLPMWFNACERVRQKFALKKLDIEGKKRIFMCVGEKTLSEFVNKGHLELVKVDKSVNFEHMFN